MNEPQPPLPDPTGPPAPPAPWPNTDPRLQRIQQFQTTALATPDPLLANLALLNGDLLLFAYRCRHAVEQALADPTRPGPAALRTLDTYLKIARQIDRFAQLDRQLRQPPQAAAAPSEEAPL